MKFEVFNSIVEQMIDQNKKIVSLSKLGVDTFVHDSRFMSVVSLLLRAYYSEPGADVVEWFVYRKNDPEIENEEIRPKAVNDSGEEVLKTIHDLWKFVEEIRVSNDYTEYELPKEQELSDKEKATLDFIMKNFLGL